MQLSVIIGRDAAAWPMTTSPQAANVDEIQSALHAALKPKGFRKQGRTFNRSTDDHLVQVINIQTGRSDLPGAVHIPDFRENLYGRFTINLGVYIPEVAKLHGIGGPKRFVQVPDCCVRLRLGQAGPEKKDIWWAADAKTEVVPDLLTRLERDGLPFLSRYESRDALIRAWRGRARPEEAGRPPRIVMAVILSARGDTNAARQLLAEHDEETRNEANPGYGRFVATELGIPFGDDLER